MSDELIFKSFGRTVFKKKVKNNKGLDHALDELREKML